jgi:hypothetical protein
LTALNLVPDQDIYVARRHPVSRDEGTRYRLLEV